MHISWRRELWVFAGILTASLVFGAITGHPAWVLAVGLGVYVFFLLRHLHHLHQWLLNKKRGAVPEAGGVWGDVFNEIRKRERDAERRKDRLTDTLQRLQEASAAIPDAIIILSQHNEIEWANRAAERLLGLRWPRDHNLRIINLVRNPDLIAYLQTGDFSETLQIPSPVTPSYTASVQIIPFGSNQKLVICRDITHLIRLEEMRRHFVANVSHELRTPVTVLIGFLETLKDMEHPQTEDLKRHLVTMHEQALRMQRLVDDLLVLSRLETSPAHVHEEVIDVPVMLHSLKELGEILSGRQHVFTIKSDPALRLVGNAEELRSAFSNLINNAIRYTPAGGVIHLHWYSDSDGAKFSVIDTGEGIPAHHIPYLTERFYRVDSDRSRATGGTGLGLSIVKHVLLRHEAKLLIESELGKGSTFTCVFPATRIVNVDEKRERIN
ncbi:MAG TPA: phosphate regulon sensor histidine kinase PhoR [Acidiferrobacterales bacterium]|nr:phosphate regulon sensor histidine kinase PhoR [Acidiferrobacterales bacterium]